MAPITVIETVENTPQGLRVSGVTFDDRGPVQIDVNGQELTVDENGPVANWTTLLPQGSLRVVVTMLAIENGRRTFACWKASQSLVRKCPNMLMRSPRKSDRNQRDVCDVSDI
ncbi:MAG: hypothetical protein AAGG48_11565 [Planctomycetota bacterium]